MHLQKHECKAMSGKFSFDIFIANEGRSYRCIEIAEFEMASYNWENCLAVWSVK